MLRARVVIVAMHRRNGDVYMCRGRKRCRLSWSWSIAANGGEHLRCLLRLSNACLTPQPQRSESPWMSCDVRIPDVGDLFDDLAEVIEEVQRLEPGKSSDFCFANEAVSR